MMCMTLLEKVEDLLKQATTDKSHFYTASVLKDVARYIRDNEQEQKFQSDYEIEQAVDSIRAECKALLRLTKRPTD